MANYRSPTLISFNKSGKLLAQKSHKPGMHAALAQLEAETYIIKTSLFLLFVFFFAAFISGQIFST